MKQGFVKSLHDILKEREHVAAAAARSPDAVKAKRPLEEAGNEVAPSVEKKQATEETNIMDRRPIKTINRFVGPAQPPNNRVKTPTAGKVVLRPKTPGAVAPAAAPAAAPARPSESAAPSGRVAAVAKSPGVAAKPAEKPASGDKEKAIAVPAKIVEKPAVAATKPVVSESVAADPATAHVVERPAEKAVSAVPKPAEKPNAAAAIAAAAVKTVEKSAPAAVVKIARQPTPVAAPVVEKPVEKPVEKRAEKIVEKEAVERPAVVVVANGASSPPTVAPMASDKPVEKSAEKAADKIVEKPIAAAKAVESPAPVASATAVKPTEKVVEKPAIARSPESVSDASVKVAEVPPAPVEAKRAEGPMPVAVAPKPGERAKPVILAKVVEPVAAPKAPVVVMPPEPKIVEKPKQAAVAAKPAESPKLSPPMAKVTPSPASAVPKKMLPAVEPPRNGRPVEPNSPLPPRPTFEDEVGPKGKWKMASKAAAATGLAEPTVVWREQWKCQKCEKMVAVEKNVCDKCFAYRPRASVVVRSWKCGCREWRSEEAMSCAKCGIMQTGVPMRPLTPELLRSFRDVVRGLLPVSSLGVTVVEVTNAVRHEGDVVPGSVLHNVIVEEKSFQVHAAAVYAESQKLLSETQRPPRVLELGPPPPGSVYVNGGYDNEVEFLLAQAFKWKERMQAAASGNHVALMEMLGNTRNVNEFQRLGMVGEGSHGVVYKAQDKKYGQEIRALKRIKLLKHYTGFPAPSLREIGFLSGMQHPNVVKIMGMAVGDSLEKVFCVLEYVEHDLGELIGLYPAVFNEAFIKTVTRQVLAGVRYLHDTAGVSHRDLKPSNMLYSKDGLVKLCDFGLAAESSRVDPALSQSAVVGTRWYRAPETVLLSPASVAPALDMWAVGCVVAEMLMKEPLFKVKDDAAHATAFRRVLGAPTDVTWPERRAAVAWPELKEMLEEPDAVVGTAKPLPQLPQIIAPLTSQGRAFLRSLLVYDPKHRPAAAASLLHNWFSSNPQPLSHASMMPQFDEAKKAEWARKKSKSKVKRNAAAATAAGGAE